MNGPQIIGGVKLIPCEPPGVNRGPWRRVVETFIASGAEAAHVENGAQKSNNLVTALNKCIRPGEPVKAVSRGHKCYLIRTEGR